MKSKNTVAQILKVYAVINFIACIILSLIIGKDINIDGIGIYFFAVSLVTNFAIFAFGEVVQLLHDIKINTNHQTQGVETKTDDSLSSTYVDKKLSILEEAELAVMPENKQKKIMKQRNSNINHNQESEFSEEPLEFCFYCGADLKGNQTACPSCGGKLK